MYIFGGTQASGRESCLSAIGQLIALDGRGREVHAFASGQDRRSSIG
jgi:hypothetical protein